MTQLIIQVTEPNGHRRSYGELLARLLAGTLLISPIRGRCFWQLVRARRVFFATIDDDYAGFIIVAIVRAILRKPTCGLFLRTLECFRQERSIVYPLKRKVFRLLRRLPKLCVLSIVPYEVRPEFREVTNNWVYDPQLWDLWTNSAPPSLPSTQLSNQVQKARGGRSVIIYIGSANRSKGFPELFDLIQKAYSKYLVVVAGKVAGEFSKEAKALIDLGMIVVDRWVTDDEILSLYTVADYAWCRYAPNYDQSSGVFGRAFQTNVVPVVREGSILEKMAQLIQVPFITLEKLEGNVTGIKSESSQLQKERIVFDSLSRLRLCAGLFHNETKQP